MNEYHIDLAVFFVKGSVDAVPLVRLIVIAGLNRERNEWSFRALGAEEVSLVVRNVVPSWNGLDNLAVVAPCSGIVVIVADLVDFSCCCESSFLAPGAGDVNYIVRAFPPDEVLAAVLTAA